MSVHFFPFYWSIKTCWLDANLFWLGVPEAVGDGGTGGTPERGRRSHLLSEGVIPPGRARPLHAALPTQLLPATLPLKLPPENLAGRPACLVRHSQRWPSRTDAPAPPHTGRWVRQPYGMTLACDAPPGFFTWCLPMPQVEFQPWN